jgi:hypothetical protein
VAATLSKIIDSIDETTIQQRSWQSTAREFNNARGNQQHVNPPTIIDSIDETTIQQRSWQSTARESTNDH